MADTTPKKKIVKVWTDGCFDMMHYGHANALRQAKALGDYLVVGVHSDADIEKHKGPPVMNEEERYKAVAACKWVDEVAKGAPFVTDLAELDKYGCDFCVHGDDIVTDASGVDTYHKVKAAGRFRVVARTNGVSTTDLVGRMLLMSSRHHAQSDSQRSAMHGMPTDQISQLAEGAQPKRSPYTSVSHFLPSSRKIVQFSEGRDPKPDDVIVYVDGGFDCFHIGHIHFLEKVKAQGTYLIVGVSTDHAVHKLKGSGFPIMNLHERVLSVLSCRFVDEVIIGAPEKLTKEIIATYKFSVVCHGAVYDHGYTEESKQIDMDEIYKVPKELGIYKQIESTSTLTTTDIVNRIIDNHVRYAARNAKKQKKEIKEIKDRD